MNIRLLPGAYTYPAQPDGNNSWYRQPVAAVTLNVTGTLFGKKITGPFTTWYSIDGGQYQEYIGQFMISKEGIMSFPTTQSNYLWNLESLRAQAIKIDMTSPTI